MIYKNMPKTGVEPEWFFDSETHVYIAWFGCMHARHLIGTHDRHLAFMQACHLAIMRWPIQGGDISIILSYTFLIDIIKLTI